MTRRQFKKGTIFVEETFSERDIVRLNEFFFVIIAGAKMLIIYIRNLDLSESVQTSFSLQEFELKLLQKGNVKPMRTACGRGSVNGGYQILAS